MAGMEPKKLSSIELSHRKGQEKLTVMTCYDSTFAKLLDGQVDCLLVGDSLGMVIQGHNNTLRVTLDQMIYHTKAVTRVAKQSHVIADMPFLSYQADPKEALVNAGKLLSEGGADSVKLEGGVRIADTVKKLVDTGIPVMGHVGLTPQSVQVFGGFKIQGKTEAQARLILEDALALEKAGCYALVLEGIPSALAAQITQGLRIPTIGIGAGRDCDGQVLVLQDALGLNPDFSPRFVKRFAHLAAQVKEAVGTYSKEVRNGHFPTKEHSF